MSAPPDRFRSPHCVGPLLPQSEPGLACGNGIPEPTCGEQCDDGNATVGDGCTAQCTIEPIFGLTAEEFMGSTDEIVEKLLMTVVRHHGKSVRKVRGVVLQDYLKGRYTETDYLSGLVVAKGKEAGVPTPANAAVTVINAQIREGKLKPQRSNLELVDRFMRGELVAP